MLRPREELILNSIIRQYISRAVPVSSSSVLDECGLDVSSATVRNDVARLEDEGYILRPHHAAGSVPSDKGYRHYVGSLRGTELPVEEQFLINHLFHQVEDRLEEWLNLAVTLLAQQVQNVAIATTPRPSASKFKHMELVSIQPQMALAVLVLHGAKVCQQLVAFDDPVAQEDLSRMAGRMNKLFAGYSAPQIASRAGTLAAAEKRVTEHILRMMQAEDNQTEQTFFLEGWHFLIKQPEFSQGARLLNLISLAEQKKLAGLMRPENPSEYGVRVVIGRENKDAAIQECSMVISRYGLPDEPLGTIALVGPTRMQYQRTIAVIRDVSSLISLLVTELYGIRPGTRSTGPHN